MKLSQEKLAEQLQISRNKIASYEGKGIEPNLTLLMKFSSFFQISIDDLLRTFLHAGNIPDAREAFLAGTRLADPGREKADILANLDDANTESINQFIDKNRQAEQMLEGFKVFYQLKSSKGPLKEEIKNLFLILENVLEANQSFVDSIKH